MAVTTLGEAYDLGWKLTAYCRHGRVDSRQSTRECHHRQELDLTTLLWTRGRDFPISRLDSRLKCPRCGSRFVVIAFQPPTSARRLAAT
jgi:hypothetical protein